MFTAEFKLGTGINQFARLGTVMKYILIILAALALVSCAATSKNIKHSKRGIHINCSGLTSSWEKCYEMAATTCDTNGYRIIAKSGDVVEDPGDYPFGLNPAGFTSRSMIVLCK
ncbi:MAG: lipoprotein [Pseudomonas sp.]|jgi:hypothetical protein|nr:lipoprotein [Pseudomonas sp.]